MPSVSFALVLNGAVAPAANAENLIERVIAAAQPCRSLRLDLGLATIGVDRFESVDVEEFLVAARNDAGEARIVGTLVCRTSNSALRTGSASAKVAFEAEFDLTTCRMQRSQVRILETGGEFGDVIDTFSGAVEGALEAGLNRQIEKLCQ